MRVDISSNTLRAARSALREKIRRDSAAGRVSEYGGVPTYAYINHLMMASQQKLDVEVMRQEFETALLAWVQLNFSAGHFGTGNNGAPATRESLFWKKSDGNYGVEMFNAAWWGWQTALQGEK